MDKALIDKYKKIALEDMGSIRCKESGSCLLAAYVMAQTLLIHGLKEFVIVEGYMKDPKNPGQLHQHTWIEVDGTKIDPTVIQFPKRFTYAGRIKKKFGPHEYLDPMTWPWEHLLGLIKYVSGIGPFARSFYEELVNNHQKDEKEVYGV